MKQTKDVNEKVWQIHDYNRSRDSGILRRRNMR